MDAVTISHKRHPQNPRRSLGPRSRVSGSSRPAFARPPLLLPTDTKRITEGASEGTLLGHRVSQPIWGAPGGQGPGRTTSSVYPPDPQHSPPPGWEREEWGRLEVKGIPSFLLTPRSARRQVRDAPHEARPALLGATRLGCGIQDTRRKEISPIHWLPGGVAACEREGGDLGLQRPLATPRRSIGSAGTRPWAFPRGPGGRAKGPP